MIERLKFRGKVKLAISIADEHDVRVFKVIPMGSWITTDDFKGSENSVLHEGANRHESFWSFVARYSIDPATVGQWTGAKDEINTDIYDGDIGLYKVRFRDGGGEKYVVVFNHEKLRWELHRLDNQEFRQLTLSEASWHFRIIGNIHDEAKHGD